MEITSKNFDFGKKYKLTVCIKFKQQIVENVRFLVSPFVSHKVRAAWESGGWWWSPLVCTYIS